MTAPMIEKVARAICAEANGPEGSAMFGVAWADYSTIYIGSAKAAIKAMDQSIDIEDLENDLAEADSLIASHAYTIDPNPPGEWPANSILKKAVLRHGKREARKWIA